MASPNDVPLTRFKSLVSNLIEDLGQKLSAYSKRYMYDEGVTCEEVYSFESCNAYKCTTCEDHKSLIISYDTYGNIRAALLGTHNGIITFSDPSLYSSDSLSLNDSVRKAEKLAVVRPSEIAQLCMDLLDGKFSNTNTYDISYE
jgi:hypothetical protein